MKAVALAVLPLFLGLTAGAYPPVPRPRENKAPANDLAKALQGTWEVTAIERGTVGGKGGVAKLPYEITMVIDGAKLTRTINLKGRELKMALTIALDAKKSPAWFDLRPEKAPQG